MDVLCVETDVSLVDQWCASASRVMDGEGEVQRETPVVQAIIRIMIHASNKQIASASFVAHLGERGVVEGAVVHSLATLYDSLPTTSPPLHRESPLPGYTACQWRLDIVTSSSACLATHCPELSIDLTTADLRSSLSVDQRTLAHLVAHLDVALAAHKSIRYAKLAIKTK